MLIIKEDLSVYEYWENGSLEDALRNLADDIAASKNTELEALIEHVSATHSDIEGWTIQVILARH